MDPSMNKLPIRPVCVGRLQVELPIQGRQDWSQSFDEAKVYRLSSSIQTQEAFWEEVERRKNELASKAHDTEESLLSDFRKFENNAAMLLYRTSEVDVYTYKVERYLWLHDRGYRFEGGVATEDRSHVDRYLGVFDRIQPNISDQDASAPGFCIDGALVVGSLPQISANVRVDIHPWDKARLHVGVGESTTSSSGFEMTITGEQTADAKLRRQQEAAKIYADHAGEIDTYPREFDILRRRDRAVSGLEGREVVWRRELVNGALLYTFKWHTIDARQGVEGRLGVNIGLDLGDEDAPNKPAPPEDEMFALWDAVLASVKVR